MEHTEDCSIHGCEGYNGPRYCDCGAAPAPQAEPREMTQAEYEVEYAKLCEKYRELLKSKEGAAPAETAQSLTQGLSAGANDAIRHENAGSLPANSQGQTLMPATSSAGEMTAEQFAAKRGWARVLKDGITNDVLYDFAEALAKQRVEQVERENDAIRAEVASLRIGIQKYKNVDHELLVKVAGLERERDEAEQLQKALDRSTSPCGHLAQYAKTEDGGKHIICLECEESELREMREALEELPLDMLDKEIENIDADEFVDNAMSFIQAMLKAKAVLARKAGS